MTSALLSAPSFSNEMPVIKYFPSLHFTSQAVWLLKCRALTQKSWVDDLEIEEEGIADLLMGI